MQQWIDSPGHYQNLIKPGFTVVGFGYKKCTGNRVYWTALYGAT
jgi:uncharacterized protein YkwD